MRATTDCFFCITKCSHKLKCWKTTHFCITKVYNLLLTNGRLSLQRKCLMLFYLNFSMRVGKWSEIHIMKYIKQNSQWIDFCFFEYPTRDVMTESHHWTNKVSGRPLLLAVLTVSPLPRCTALILSEIHRLFFIYILTLHCREDRVNLISTKYSKLTCIQ